MKNNIVEEDLDQIHETIKFKGNWKKATIVITGCAGFLGYYFLNYFVIRGNDLGIKKVIALDNFQFGKPKWLMTLESNFSSLLTVKSFDISQDDIKSIKDISQTRYVIHGASIASPSFYRKYPIETINANIWGLKKLLNFFNGNKNL
jgi:UDP-glucuronate decarboxylase